MKQKFLALVFAVLACTNARASCVVGELYTTDNVNFEIMATWTAEAGGTVPLCYLGWPRLGQRGMIWEVIAVPGVPAPTPMADMWLYDETGVPIMGDGLMNLSNNSVENRPPLSAAGTPYPRFFTGPLSFNLTGNVVEGAKGVVRIHFVQKHKF